MVGPVSETALPTDLNGPRRSCRSGCVFVVAARYNEFVFATSADRLALLLPVLAVRPGRNAQGLGDVAFVLMRMCGRGSGIAAEGVSPLLSN